MPLRFRRFPFLSAAILALLTARLSWAGSGIWGVTGLVLAALWFGIELVRWLLPPREPGKAAGRAVSAPSGASEAQSLVSLVYFLSESRRVDEAAIRDCVSSALGIRFQVNDPDADTFVIPFSPPDRKKSDSHIRHFMVRIPDGLFAVLVSDRPYIDNPKDFARDSIRDKRLRSAVERHLAWISVDLMDDPTDPAAVRRAYQVIGKILASMAGPDCLAIYCPEMQRCNEFDPGLIETLSGPDPLDLFEEPTFEPVIEISDNNPRMAAAVREAVTRWPEFVAAFEGSPLADRDRYIVKAEFREGKKAEYMWVSVEEIAPDGVTGVLMNDPHELLEVHRGARVHFTLDRLNDWIYPGRGGSHVGGFTLDVLADDGEM
jgi:uncharacterized protein YegJ (DUF2314 family)